MKSPLAGFAVELLAGILWNGGMVYVEYPMIVNSPFYIQPYRVGLYQLIGFGLFAVPLRGKTGPALLFPFFRPFSYIWTYIFKPKM